MITMSLNSKSPHGCFLPMNALTIHPQGQVHYCLTSKLPAPKSLAELDLLRQSIHTKLLNNEYPESCRSCKNKQDNGLNSRRMHFWNRKSNFYGPEAAAAMVTQAQKPILRHLEISFSNTCNLSCAMCSSEFSSSWIQHDKKAIESGLEFRNFTKIFSQTARISKDLVQEILDRADSLDLILIKGGEPTADPMCIYFLKQLAEKKLSRTSVFIQTNGTIAPEKWLNDLNHISFDIGISMDGFGDVFNWIRGPFFDQVLNHISILSSSEKIKSITIDFTLSAFNVYHLPDFFEKILQLKKQFPKIKQCPVFQWVQQPYASPLAIPLNDRLKILSDLQKFIQGNESFFLDYSVLETILQQPRSSNTDISKVQKWFTYLNQIRGFSVGEHEQKIISALSLNSNEI
jgi:organic radical activating enzyme